MMTNEERAAIERQPNFPPRTLTILDEYALWTLRTMVALWVPPKLAFSGLANVKGIGISAPQVEVGYDDPTGDDL